MPDFQDDYAVAVYAVADQVRRHHDQLAAIEGYGTAALRKLVKTITGPHESVRDADGGARTVLRYPADDRREAGEGFVGPDYFRYEKGVGSGFPSMMD